jgi:predicted DNA-binding transcriptional regulator AlpA
MLNLSELARFLGVSRPTAYKFIVEPDFPQATRIWTKYGFQRVWNMSQVVIWWNARNDY